MKLFPLKHAMLSVFMSAIVICAVANDLPDQLCNVSTNQVRPGIIPAAVYRCIGTNGVYLCAGTVFWEGTNDCRLILPLHAFQKVDGDDGNYYYGVRFLRPDKHRISGYISEVKPIIKSNAAADLAVAHVEAIPAVKSKVISEKLAPFTDKLFDRDIFSVIQPEVIIGGRPVKKLRSVFSGKEVRILEHGFIRGKESPVKPNLFFLVIDIKAGPGSSGISFIDDYGRLYILQGASRIGDQEIVIGPVNLDLRK